MNLKHVFKSECPNVEELFSECSTLDTYFANLQKQVCKVKTSRYIEHGFEALVEVLCKKGTTRVKNYTPRPSCDNDLFVNGIGEKSSGKKVAVMVCLVADTNVPLASNPSHITSFTSNAAEKFGVEINEPRGFRIFSNAKSIHENMLTVIQGDKAVVFYLKSDIEKIVTGNEAFWTRFEKAMKTEAEPEPEIVKTTEIPVDVVGEKLRDFQKEASKAITDNVIGQVILPTGTGKTLIAINAIYKEIRSESTKGNKSPCILIMTPRIVLTYQLLGEVISYFKTNKMDAQYLNLNSGEFNDDDIKKAMAETGLPIRDVPSTTTIREMEFFYDKAVRDGVPFIIGATYQSAPRIKSTKIPIHMAIHDEAHNLVIGRFSTKAKQRVLKIDAKKKVFLTATPAYSRDIKEEVPESDEPYKGLGMENEANYGKEICRKSPRTMIDAGEIVPPRIHVVNVNEIEIKGKNIDISYDKPMDEAIEKDVDLMARVVDESFDAHLEQIHKDSCSPEKIGAKIIVVCSGDITFRGLFENSSYFKEMQKRTDVKFFGISSAYGAWINGVHIPPQGSRFKEDFMLALRNLKPEDNAIIFHIDMLGEGVDIPGITGVLPFRDLGTIKSCQTLGRAMRIVPEDRNNLYGEKIFPADRNNVDNKKWIKPFAWAIIPVYSVNHIDIKQRLTDVVKNIRSNYEYKPSENFIIHPTGTKYPGGEVEAGKGKVDGVEMDQIIEEIMIDNAAEERQAAVMKELEELVKNAGAKTEIAQPSNVVQEIPVIENQGEETFTMTYNGITARGIIRGDKFVVMAGSEVRERITASFQTTVPCYMRIRSCLLSQGKIIDWKTVEDIEFESPSAAASILIGSAINGKTAWKLNGRTIKELE